MVLSQQTMCDPPPQSHCPTSIGRLGQAPVRPRGSRSTGCNHLPMAGWRGQRAWEPLRELPHASACPWITRPGWCGPRAPKLRSS